MTDRQCRAEAPESGTHRGTHICRRTDPHIRHVCAVCGHEWLGPRRGDRSTHAVRGGCLRQRDLPVHSGHLSGVRVVEANVPRITGPDWLFFHDVTEFRIDLPEGLAAGQVVEWDDQPPIGPGPWYTVVTEITAESVTFAHCGRGPDGALAAALAANAMNDPPPPERDRPPEPGRIVVSVVRERGDYATSTAWLVPPGLAAWVEQSMRDSGAAETHGLMTLDALRQIEVISDEEGGGDRG
jgi:hypothetical protein